MGYIYWDPDRALFPFAIPFINRPILWYGFLFALGFFLAYWVLVYLLQRYLVQDSPLLKGEEKRIGLSKHPLRLINQLLAKTQNSVSVRSLKTHTRSMADQLTLYVMIGSLVGARLGDLLFYQDWKQLVQDPSIIVKVWEGGLASHGGAVGILIALVVFTKRYSFCSFKQILDLVVIPTALAATCIRIGNFVNQEILGTQSTLPWAVIFGHPIDGSPSIPRHPVQIYEALTYLAIFGILLGVWRKDPFLKKGGRIGGLFLILVFTARFVLEFFKEEQSVYFNQGMILTMGQLLSIPFIGWGFFLFIYRKN
jgi:phosphatidylglycerol---prolipoprotein diacylglyceryl transferase